MGALAAAVSASGERAAALSGHGALTAQLQIRAAATLAGHGTVSASATKLTGIPIAELVDSFGFRDDTLWSYQGSAAVIDSQLHLSGV
jgi:hypothetical protein